MLDTDDVIVGLESGPAAPQSALLEDVQRVYPYRQVSLYAAALQRCAYDAGLYIYETSANVCSAGTLPLLQADAGLNGIPTIAQVMDRVLVSHDFLGANLEEFLRFKDPHGDFRRLLGGTSAIVLGSHVRPSYYQVGTGAIYLDAHYLWLTAAQRDVVTEVPDYRLAFADNVNFVQLGRQVRNNDYAQNYLDIEARQPRDLDQLVYGLGRLLYHELAHAADFLPPTERNLNPALSIFANALPRINAGTLMSDVLDRQFPLQSLEWKGLGQVLYRGATPSAEQRASTAAQVGGFFAADVANDDYAYSNYGGDASREDPAMLFEEFMMYYRHGVRVDVAYVDVPQGNQDIGGMVLQWGQRGRIGEAAIKPRLRLVLGRVAPWIDLAAVDSLPAPIALTGLTWDASLLKTSAGMMRRSAQQQGAAGAREVRDDRKQLRPHGPTPLARQP